MTYGFAGRSDTMHQARYYNPGIGKFIQADPLRYGAGMNLYDFCNGDPINHSDPSGLQELGPWENFLRFGRTAGELGRNAAGDLLKEDDEGGIIRIPNPSGPNIDPRVDPTPLNRGITPTVGPGPGGDVPAPPGLFDPSNLDFSSGSQSTGQPQTLQSDGHTLEAGTAKSLNRTFDYNLPPRDWGRALEAMKKDNSLPSDFYNTKILDNGDVLNARTGETLGNLDDYL
jgi:RHS repeat-associated protein